jgi:hypothetical protein
MQYGVFTCMGVSRLVGRRVCSHTPYCMYNCLPEEKPTRFETYRRQQKLNINLENCTFRWFVLHNFFHIFPNLFRTNIPVIQLYINFATGLREISHK